MSVLCSVLVANSGDTKIERVTTGSGVGDSECCKRPSGKLILVGNGLKKKKLKPTTIFCLNILSYR